MVPEKISQNDVSTPCRAAAVRNVTGRSILGRVLAGFLMGGLTLALMALGAGFETTDPHPLAQSILPVAVIATVLVATFSSTVRAAWGRLCLINGILSVALAAASVQGRGQPLSPTDPGYERTLDRRSNGRSDT